MHNGASLSVGYTALDPGSMTSSGTSQPQRANEASFQSHEVPGVSKLIDKESRWWSPGQRKLRKYFFFHWQCWDPIQSLVHARQLLYLWATSPTLRFLRQSLAMNPGWAWTQHPPASSSQELGFQVCTLWIDEHSVMLMVSQKCECASCYYW
jgi:hypothetical protein